MAHLEDRDWLPIAKQASTEMDPKKLMILVVQLCEALDKRTKDTPLQPTYGD